METSRTTEPKLRSLQEKAINLTVRERSVSLVEWIDLIRVWLVRYRFLRWAAKETYSVQHDWAAYESSKSLRY